MVVNITVLSLGQRFEHDRDGIARDPLPSRTAQSNTVPIRLPTVAAWTSFPPSAMGRSTALTWRVSTSATGILPSFGSA